MILNKVIEIQTERLVIRTMPLNFISEILNENVDAYKHIGVKANEEWPSSDIKPVLPMFKRQLENKMPEEYGPWIYIDKMDNTIIGDGGFMGAPSAAGEIDIGYNIIESKRNLGYGYEAAKALIDWAFSKEGVKVVKADCLKDNVPSINLLKKVGMIKISEDKELFYFHLKKEE